MDDTPLVLGTAGHVDHGKTALVRALTGHDTDRLPAEKQRGMSIELGFAPLELPSGRRVSLVDVPGHERFVRHMVAGASGVDGWLLCVAADDGVMPQTREHMQVLHLLGIGHGVVAITRADLADPAPAAAQARDLVGAGPEVLAVSATRGEGIGALRDALERLVAGLAPARRAGPARLFVDRAFAMPGAGTVVTGTLWGDALARGDRVRVLPGDRAARIRRIETHGAAAERAVGGRVALALPGVSRDQAPRGSCVVAADSGCAAVTRIAARVRWTDPGAPGRRTRRARLFLGTAESDALWRPRRDDPETIDLRLESPVPALPGDRFVLRAPGGSTIGGGEVIAQAPAPAGPSPAPTPAPAPAPAAVDPVIAAAVAAVLEQAGLRPPPPAVLAQETGLGAAGLRDVLEVLRADGRVVRAGDLWFASGPALDARRAARAALAERPLSLGELRDLWGVGRRHALALAEHLDEQGLTAASDGVRILRRGARED